MNIVGVVLFIISLIVRINSILTIDKNYSWTLEIRDNHKLVTNGIYRYVRHPIYLGSIIGAISIPIYALSFTGFLISLLAIPLFSYRIRIEEEMLVEEFGDEYIKYQEHTRKLFPFIY
jgi:protein-S-isoprenylcysteine O-methyltransferase Ste14